MSVSDSPIKGNAMCLKINYINMFDIPSNFKRVDKNDS